MPSTQQKEKKLMEVSIPETLHDISTLLRDSEALKQCKCSYHKHFIVSEKDKHLLDKTSQYAYVYAIMSSDAYDGKVQIDIPGWKRTKRLMSQHGFSADIYVSYDKKDIAIAFRGTDDKNDWQYANIDINTDGQYGDADTLFEEVLLEHPNKTIITTGHSLGGGLAMHISLLNEGIDAVVFNPSPRVFSQGNYDKYANNITIIYEAGEVLNFVRKLFKTLKKIKHKTYRYNFLGGNSIKEHGIEAFARCMYASIHKKESHYEELCKKNA